MVLLRLLAPEELALVTPPVMGFLEAGGCSGGELSRRLGRPEDWYGRPGAPGTALLVSFLDNVSKN